MAQTFSIDEWNKKCEEARKRSYERTRIRNEIMKKGNLPYSFTYKMRKAFIGKECPICHIKMGIPIREDGDPIIAKTPVPSIQHNIPLSKGGKNEIENISIVCRSCNSKLQSRITGKLNNEEVIRVWQTMTKKDFIG